MPRESASHHPVRQSVLGKTQDGDSHGCPLKASGANVGGTSFPWKLPRPQSLRLVSALSLDLRYRIWRGYPTPLKEKK